jgi:hypothetical protein
MAIDITSIKFKVTDKYMGYPEPFIPDGTIVLLIQNGEVIISKYHEPTDIDPYPSFSHPKLEIGQNKEIQKKVYEIIKNEYPRHLKSEESNVLTCPLDFAKEIIW